MRSRGSAAKPARKRESEPAQLALFKQRGGKRQGAGRRPKGHRAGAPHKTREALRGRYPVHVTLRVVREIGSLRRKAAYHAIRQATLTTAASGRIRIVQASIQRSHIHLLVEAKNKKSLAAGLQGFQVSAAKHLNAAFGKMTRGPRRRGTVFSDRYHAEIITSPTQARQALSYVMMNWRNMGKIVRRSWPGGRSTGFRALRLSRIGRSTATRHFSGGDRLRTIRSGYGDLRRGCSQKVGKRSMRRFHVSRSRLHNADEPSVQCSFVCAVQSSFVCALALDRVHQVRSCRSGGDTARAKCSSSRAAIAARPLRHSLC